MMFFNIKILSITNIIFHKFKKLPQLWVKNIKVVLIKVLCEQLVNDYIHFFRSFTVPKVPGIYRKCFPADLECF